MGSGGRKGSLILIKAAAQRAAIIGSTSAAEDR